MLKSTWMFLIALLILSTSGCIENTISSMPSAKDASLDYKIGQMFMIGFKGLEVDKNSPVIKSIQNQYIGGIILFDYDVQQADHSRNISNPSQLKKLTSDLQTASKTPLFIAIDQEGGKVCRLKEEYGFTSIPSAAELGQSTPKETYEYALKNADQLKQMGININFAPVVDINTNPDNPVIAGKERSYSPDPEIVYEHAKAFINAHKSKNIMCCLKHFPGHGSSKADSHVGFVDVTQTWDDSELLPYTKLFNQGYDGAVMTAHIYNSRLDDKYPATLSKATVTDLLRDKLEFNGLIITDDMQMGAISKNYGFEAAIERAVLAGCDIILLANNSAYGDATTSKAVNVLKNMLQQCKIDEKRINLSYNRIRHAKLKLAK